MKPRSPRWQAAIDAATITDAPLARIARQYGVDLRQLRRVLRQQGQAPRGNQ